MSSFHYTGPCIYLSSGIGFISTVFFTNTRRYNFINELLLLEKCADAAAIVSAQGLGSPSISSDSLEISIKYRFKEHVSTFFQNYMYIIVYIYRASCEL